VQALQLVVRYERSSKRAEELPMRKCVHLHAGVQSQCCQTVQSLEGSTLCRRKTSESFTAHKFVGVASHKAMRYRGGNFLPREIQGQQFQHASFRKYGAHFVGYRGTGCRKGMLPEAVKIKTEHVQHVFH